MMKSRSRQVSVESVDSVTSCSSSEMGYNDDDVSSSYSSCSSSYSSSSSWSSSSASLSHSADPYDGGAHHHYHLGVPLNNEPLFEFEPLEAFELTIKRVVEDLLRDHAAAKAQACAVDIAACAAELARAEARAPPLRGAAGTAAARRRMAQAVPLALVAAFEAEPRHAPFLGKLLGLLTLARDRPLLHATLDVRERLARVLATPPCRRQRCVISANTTFVVRLLEGSAGSRAFGAKSPWVAAVLGDLRKIRARQPARPSGRRTTAALEIDKLFEKVGLPTVDKDTAALDVAATADNNSDAADAPTSERAEARARNAAKAALAAAPAAAAGSAAPGADDAERRAPVEAAAAVFVPRAALPPLPVCFEEPPRRHDEPPVAPAALGATDLGYFAEEPEPEPHIVAAALACLSDDDDDTPPPASAPLAAWRPEPRVPPPPGFAPPAVEDEGSAAARCSDASARDDGERDDPAPIVAAAAPEVPLTPAPPATPPREEDEPDDDPAPTTSYEACAPIEKGAREGEEHAEEARDDDDAAAASTSALFEFDPVEDEATSLGALATLLHDEPAAAVAAAAPPAAEDAPPPHAAGRSRARPARCCGVCDRDAPAGCKGHLRQQAPLLPRIKSRTMLMVAVAAAGCQVAVW